MNAATFSLNRMGLLPFPPTAPDLSIAKSGSGYLRLLWSLGGSYAASISSMVSPAANGSVDEEPPVLACEAAVDSALAPSDIVANVCRVRQHTPRRRGILHVVPRLGNTNFSVPPLFCNWCVGVCVRCVVKRTWILLQQCTRSTSTPAVNLFRIAHIGVTAQGCALKTPHIAALVLFSIA